MTARIGVWSSQSAAVGAGYQSYCGSGQSVRDVAGQAEGQSQEGPETSEVFGESYFIPLHVAGNQPPLELFLRAAGPGAGSLRRHPRQ